MDCERCPPGKRAWVYFLIYINDMGDNLDCNAYLFADEMKIYTNTR